MELIKKLKRQVASLKVETHALYLACRDPRTPWYAKLLAVGVLVYAVSPIDPIPDFIPVIGLLDDLVIVRLGTALVVRMIPEQVMAECRERAQNVVEPGTSIVGTRCLVAAAIIAVGCLLAALVTLLTLILVILLILKS